jgi:hypothetical protein
MMIHTRQNTSNSNKFVLIKPHIEV